jgi:hypothetical protein
MQARRTGSSWAGGAGLASEVTTVVAARSQAATGNPAGPVALCPQPPRPAASSSVDARRLMPDPLEPLPGSCARHPRVIGAAYRRG